MPKKMKPNYASTYLILKLWPNLGSKPQDPTERDLLYKAYT